jgi:SSS family solute:Na+ symporter
MIGRAIRRLAAHGLRALRVVAATLVVSAILGAPAHAESLTRVERTALPPLPPATALRGLVAIDGQAVAFIGGAALRLDANAQHWLPLALPTGSDANFALLVGDGTRAYALSPAAGVTGDRMFVARADALHLDGDRLRMQALPPLPMPLSGARAASSDDGLFVGGRDDAGRAHLFELDPGAAAPQWRTHPGWPGGGAIGTLVSQAGKIVVSVPTPGQGDAIWGWTPDAGWRERGHAPGDVVADAARGTGQAHALYLITPQRAGGDAVPPGADEPAMLMTYQVITGAWAPLPGAGAIVVQHAMAWKDGLLWAQPQADGGVAMSTLQIQARKLLLRWLDWVVIIVYLASMIGIGLYFYLREKRGSTANFFVGGRSIPFWAAGISLYAANTSSISFIAIPAKAFESNWQYLTNNLIAVLGLMFVAVWIVPLLRRLDLMSVFSYLETRFHPAIRMLASGLAILTQIGSRMSVILLLPAIAISTITGLNVALSIALMGGFTIVYTAMGGMKAVIWTDVVQVIVKMGGAIFAIGFIIWGLRGGFGEFMATANAEDKMHLFDFSFDLTKATVWGFVFLVLFDVVLTFPKDQVLMQRTLSTKSDKEAGRSIWAFAAIMIPGGFVFYMIGTALFVFYKAHPERMNPLLPIDATFPLFIGAELPMGVTGLIIAGIFAAAMATLSGIMNSVATLISVDFYERLVKNPSQRKGVFFAEMMTVAVGLVGIGVALLLSRYNARSLFDVSIELAGLLGGGFAGAYTLGMFTRRANSPGVAIGIGASMVLTLIAWSFKLVHPYFYLAISILLCIVIGYVASLFFPAPQRSLEGLTIYTRKRG